MSTRTAPELEQRPPQTKKFIDMTGQKCGRLTVTGFAGWSGKFAKWNCLCECGKTCVAYGSLIRNGKTQSCGCLTNRHGLSRTDVYHIWYGMLERCENPKAKGYKNYGGRGITVCDRWRESVENFIADIGPRPSPGHSIGRIDNHGHYDPSNVRWETRAEQGRNTRNCRYVTFDGEKKTLAEWASTLGITREAMRLRLKKGASVESIVTTPRGGVVVERSRSKNGLWDDATTWPSVFPFNTVLHCEAASDYLAGKLSLTLRQVAVRHGYKFRGRLLGTHVLFEFRRRKPRSKNATPAEATP